MTRVFCLAQRQLTESLLGQKIIHLQVQITIHLRDQNTIHLLGQNTMHLQGQTITNLRGQNTIHLRDQIQYAVSNGKAGGARVPVSNGFSQMQLI